MTGDTPQPSIDHFTGKKETRMKNCNTNGQRVTRTMPLFASIAALGMALTFALPQAAYAQGVTPPT